MTVDERARGGHVPRNAVSRGGAWRVQVTNFLRTAATATRGEAPKLRHWVKEVRESPMDSVVDGPIVCRAQRQRRFLRRREEAVRNSFSLELLKPKLAILDEIDSGLDVDALKVVSDGINRRPCIARARGGKTGLMLITHYTRILRYVKPDYVHVFFGGRIVEEGRA